MITSNDSIVTAKEERRALRMQLLNSRQSLSVSEKKALDSKLRLSLSELLGELPLKPQRIALYWPIQGEPDMIPLAKDWLASGGEVLLPMLVNKNAPLQFGFFTSETTLKIGAYNIPEPDVSKFSLETPKVVVIPCVGFNSDNFRLGYGGGYYDRTLAAWRERGEIVLTVGVAYSRALVDFKQSEFDLPLDMILTA